MSDLASWVLCGYVVGRVKYDLLYSSAVAYTSVWMCMVLLSLGPSNECLQLSQSVVAGEHSF